MPDAPRITPPVLEPGFRSGHDVSIDVKLEAGVPVASVTSTSHRILSRRTGRTGHHVSLAPDDRLPNKDFILRWSVASEAPAVGLLVHRSGIDGFFTLLVQPKGEITGLEAAPKEIVLVLDTSGSMSGLPLEASKRFVRDALETLGPRDTFNLVRFSGNAESLAPKPLPNEPAAVAKGLAWIGRLAGGGGTEMLRGFKAAFAMPADPDRMRIVVFLTDGYIGNEEQILAAVGEVVGQARIFTLGIGSSVNHHLLDSMARLGGGAYVFIRPDERADRAVERFRSWVTRPYLTDLEIDWGALPIADVLPTQPRDLFSGQTLQLVGRYLEGGAGEVVVRGKLGGSYWEQRLEVKLPEREERHPALAAVWARQRIGELMLESPRGAALAVQAEITALALEYRLVSAFTSFVAVDDSTVVDGGGDTATVRQALPVPDGVSFAGVFGAEGPPAMRPPPQRFIRPSSVPGISVQVFDDRGNPLPGATVTISHEMGFVKTTSLFTDAKGVAEFPVLRPGDGYSIRVAFPGFADQVQAPIHARNGSIERITVAMTAEITESVTVKAQRDVVDLEDTSSTTRFSDDFVSDLPVPGRFYQKVLTLSPGAQDSDGGVSNVDPLTGQALSMVNPNSIEAMEVITAGASVQYGRAQGGFASVVTKPSEAPADDAAPLLDAALRILADLAEDGRLSPAEGRVALAGLLAIQHSDGELSPSPEVQALGTWALAEAAAVLPNDPWISGARDRAVGYLFNLPSGLEGAAAIWCRRVARWVRPPAALPGETVRAGWSELAREIVAARPVHAKVDASGHAPFDRLVRAIPRGKLKVAG